MPMPGRWMMDTATQVTTVTQSTMVPTPYSYTHSLNSLNAPGWTYTNVGAQMLVGGGGLKLTWGSGLSGCATATMPVTPNVPTTVYMQVTNANASPAVDITETVGSTTTTLASEWIGISGSYLYVLAFTPTQSQVKLSMCAGPNYKSSGQMTVQKVWYDRYNYVPGTALVKVTSKAKDNYRFGFNGQEKVNDIAGIGNHNTALFWEYDTRLARRWNVDPVDQISISNYAVLGLNPISRIDPLGNTDDHIEVDAKEKTYRVTKTDDSYDDVSERVYNGNSSRPVQKVVNGATAHYQKDAYQEYLKKSGYSERAPLRGAQSEEFAVEMAALDGVGKLMGYGLKLAWGRMFGNAAVTKTTQAVVTAANQTTAKTGMTTVGRWMSNAEYEIMAKTGQMVEGSGGQTFVATGGPGAFNAAARGSVYAEFDVATNSLVQGGQANWFKVLGPSAGKAMQAALQKQGDNFSLRLKTFHQYYM